MALMQFLTLLLLFSDEVFQHSSYNNNIISKKSDFSIFFLNFSFTLF